MALVGSFFEFKNQKKEYNGAGEPKRNKRHNIWKLIYNATHSLRYFAINTIQDSKNRNCYFWVDFKKSYNLFSKKKSLTIS